MNNIALSVLIPTVEGRGDNLSRLLEVIGEQIGPLEPIERLVVKANENGEIKDCLQVRYRSQFPVEVIVISDAKEMSIGFKRELLHGMAIGDYIFSVDDDDSISPKAIQTILNALEVANGVDCITFQEYVSINGVEYKSNHSLTYGAWEGEGNREFQDGFHFHRTPFMKSVIKTEIAKRVQVPFMRWGEDNEWSVLLKPHLRTEYHIPENLYLYTHVSTEFNERYGIK